jgi:hypothetical protein
MTAPPHLDQRMPSYQIANQRSNVAAGGDTVVRRSGQNVNTAYACYMDNHFPIICPAEREPRVAFVRQAALGIYLQARLNQCGLDPIEFGELSR